MAVAASIGWVDDQWDNAISLAIAVSFLISSPINKSAHRLYREHRDFLMRFETHRVRESHPDTSRARVIVLGMGNIGTGAYDSVAEQHGDEVLGVDDNDRKLERHRREHRRVVAADASDPDFWHRVNLDEVELIMLALTNHEENKLVADLLRDIGYEGRIAAVVRFSEEEEELGKRGISSFNLYAQAGSGFAAHAMQNAKDGD